MSNGLCNKELRRVSIEKSHAGILILYQWQLECLKGCGPTKILVLFCIKNDLRLLFKLGMKHVVEKIVLWIANIYRIEMLYVFWRKNRSNFFFYFANKSCLSRFTLLNFSSGYSPLIPF